jgi:hypothetical protein
MATSQRTSFSEPSLKKPAGPNAFHHRLLVLQLAAASTGASISCVRLLSQRLRRNRRRQRHPRPRLPQPQQDLQPRLQPRLTRRRPPSRRLSAPPARAGVPWVIKQDNRSSFFCLNRNATFAPKAHIRSAPWPVSLSILGAMRDGPLNSSPSESKDATFSENRLFRANYTVSFALSLFVETTDCLS